MVLSNYNQSRQVPPGKPHHALGVVLKITPALTEFLIIYFTQSSIDLKSLYLTSGPLHSGDFFF